MKYADIRMIARENEVLDYFKQLYKHSIQVLESISDETMKTILFKKRTGMDDYDNSYNIGIIDGFVFQNVIGDGEDEDKRCIDKIWVSADVLYVGERDDLSYDTYTETEECLEIASSFDYHYLVVKLSFGKDEIHFWQDTFGVEDIKREDKIFLKALTKREYLERIFGEYLIEASDAFFIVSSKCFED